MSYQKLMIYSCCCYQFFVMAAQKWTVFFASLVLVAFMEESKLAMASEGDLKSKTICENQKATISCPNGGNIKVIEASYGRHNLYQCPSTAPSVENTDCHSFFSLPVAQRDCENKPSCELYASNSVFGHDPCPGTYKYLEVKFKCTVAKSIVICEYLNDTISCQDGSIIEVLQASYGRHDLSTCPNPYIDTTNCHAGNSHGIVEGTCGNKPSCELYADNSVFGDPCLGTYKYLRVRYQCIYSYVICEGGKRTIS
ncbi:L-rhamnose-binding lectin CSL3-like isoform X1 [Oculina patagonica]